MPKLLDAVRAVLLVPGLLVLLLCTAGGARAQDGVATDRAALQALYDAANGAAWTDATSWSSGEPLASWHGVTTDGDGRVTRLELGDNGLSGTLPPALGHLARLEALLLDGNVHLAGPLPAGLRELPALATVDLTGTELCAPQDTAFQDWTATISFSGLICPPQSQTVIDAAVFYTPAARDDAGGTAAIEAEIDLMAAETNLAFRAGGVNQRVVLAAVEEVRYAESSATSSSGSSLLRDLGRLHDPSDGHLDVVHGTRDRVAADIVVLFRTGSGGYAYGLTPSNASAANAFAVSGRSSGSSTFVHELGHLMGLAHDRYTACVLEPPLLGNDGCSEGATAYAYGYVNRRVFDDDAPASARWRTLMSYDRQCGLEGCQRLMRFSNPDQVHPAPGGDPMGVTGSEPSTAPNGPADGARALDRTRATVASFRTPPPVTVSFAATVYTAAEGGQAATVTVSLSAAPGRSVSVPLLSMGAGGATASDYTAPASVAFAADATAQTFTVTAVDDAADDDGETVALEFDTSLLPSGMTVGRPATATVTLADDGTVTAAPSVSAVALTSDSGPDGIYALGDQIEATVRFDKSVTVTGVPQLGLTVGSGTRQMTHRGGGGDVLTFAYAVVEGDGDADGVSIAADSLSGSLRDGAEQAAGLTHAAVAADRRHRVDGVRPLLQEAVVDGEILRLAYDEALHESVPFESGTLGRDAFTVSDGDDTPPPVVERAFVRTGRRELRLVLSRPVVHGQDVTVSYTPGAWSIRDAAGTEAAAFSDRSVTNETAEAHYDTDRDGLIEITTLAQLDAIRHDLDSDGSPATRSGRAYRAAFPLAFAEGDARLRCHGWCTGYELHGDLDFDTNGSGGPDAGDAYWHGGAGWQPIAGRGNSFMGTLEGNGHTIRHLFVNRPDTDRVGLFGLAGWGGAGSSIRAVGVIEIDVTGNTWVGGLVGHNHGVVAASYAIGPVSGNSDVGGLVGRNSGTITASHATGPVSGNSDVGGLAGRNYRSGAVAASYATGLVSGNSDVGGLVGENRSGAVAASYATGPVSGTRNVGGLVGHNSMAWEGAPRGTIAASYATGRVSGGQRVGGLVGWSSSGETGASYWDTTTSNRATSDGGAGRSTATLQAPTGYSGLYADWNVDLDGDGAADDPWHFGTSGQYPALKADIDGEGTATWLEFGRQLRAGPTLTATGTAGGDAVALSWTAVDASHWSSPPGVTYTVTRDDGATVTVIADAVAGPGAADTGVVPGGAYAYQVSAVVDGGAAAHSAPKRVVAGNRPPVTVGTLAERRLRVEDGAVDVDVAASFSDPENDVLTYGAVSSAPAVAGVSASGTTVRVRPLTAGTATITVAATDAVGSGGTAALSFTVTVANRSPVAVGALGP